MSSNTDQSGSQRIMLPKRRMNSGRSLNRPTEHRRPYSEPVRHSSYTRAVNDSELDVIVERITRPTVSSRGGVDLLDKDFTYIKPRPRKTLIIIPGLERRYMGLQKVSREEMKHIIARLTRMTTAYTAKFGPDRNVWVDDSPRTLKKFRPHSVI